jgi:hypothetical protein
MNSASDGRQYPSVGQCSHIGGEASQPLDRQYKETFHGRESYISGLPRATGRGGVVERGLTGVDSDKVTLGARVTYTGRSYSTVSASSNWIRHSYPSARSCLSGQQAPAQMAYSPRLD